jgi:citrate lyase subunit beta/citryl-CoA lyase
MDLAADLGLEPDEQGSQLGYARSLIVIASRHASLAAPAAPVSANIDATELLTADTQSLRRAGFFGRDCIHPAQVAVANGVFQPTPEELDWARRILADAATLGGAFRAPDGSMVDEAVLRRARAVLGEPFPPQLNNVR